MTTGDFIAQDEQGITSIAQHNTLIQNMHVQHNVARTQSPAAISL